MLIQFLVILAFTRNNFPLAQISLAPRDQPDRLNVEYVSNCCTSTIRESSLELLKCVAEVTENAELNKKWLADHATPRIGLISYATEDVANYAAYSFGINQAYSEQNGYMFRLADPEINYEPRDVRWNKVQIVLHALRTWAKTADYLVWLDADLIFLDMGLKLELVIKDYPNAHMWVSTEHTFSTSLTNSGLMIVKNSEFIVWFLEEWWLTGDRAALNDQESFDMLYTRYKTEKDLEVKVVVLPADALNSYPPAYTAQKDYNQVLHLMGNPGAYRSRVFSSAFAEVCRVVRPESIEDIDAVNRRLKQISRPPEKLQRQLGVDRQHLLGWGLVEYKKIIEDAIEKFTAKLNATAKAIKAGAVLSPSPGEDGSGWGGGGWYVDSYTAGSAATLIVNYCEVLEYLRAIWDSKHFESLQRGGKTPLDEVLWSGFPVSNSSSSDGDVGIVGIHPYDPKELRMRSFYLLDENLKISTNNKALKAYSISTGERAALIREILAPGMNMMRIVRSAEERLRIGDRLGKMAKELLTIDQAGKKNYALNMIGDIHVEKGHVYISEKDFDEALEELFKGLKVKESIAEGSGEHVLSNLLVIIADTLCKMGRYREAWPHFDRAVRIYEKRMGSLDAVLGQYLVLSARGRIAGGDYKTAVGQLERALVALEFHEKDINPGDVSFARSLLLQAREQSESQGEHTITSTTSKTAGAARAGTADNAGKGSQGTSEQSTKSSKKKTNKKKSKKKIKGPKGVKYVPSEEL